VSLLPLSIVFLIASKGLVGWGFDHCTDETRAGRGLTLTREVLGKRSSGWVF